MSETKRRQPLLLAIYEQFLNSRDTVAFVFALRKRYAPAALEKLARHTDCRVRRAAICAMGFIAGFEFNDTVGMAMVDEDRTVRLLAEHACRRVWNRFGTPDQRQGLGEVIRCNAARKYREALERASELLEESPRFAEIWYQRGSAWFQLGEYEQALDDWYQTLELNAYHFVAAVAIGEAHLRLDDRSGALEAFQRALSLNPDLDRVRNRITDLECDADEE